MNWRAAKTKEIIRASALLALILTALFLPYVAGYKTLLLSVRDAPSVMNSGAYDQGPPPPWHINRTPDPGAPAWVSEPWLKLIGDQYWKEHNFPLWNPYSSYGTPLAAAMQPQPFFPLAMLASLNVTPWSYNFFILSRLLLAGVLTFLFARLFLSNLPSVFASVTFMLTGYFITFLNMPHLSVEILTPGIVLTFELILRRNSWCSVAAASAMIFLGMAGGMPESLFLILAFGSLYFLCRLLLTPEFRRNLAPLLGKLVAAIVLGFALSAFLLLPFLELVRIAHDVHQPSNVDGDQPGLIADIDYRTTILYLLPLVFGPVANSIFGGLAGWSGMRSYWGIVPSFFAAAAILIVIFRGRAVRPVAVRFLTGFFAITLVLMLLKRYGHPLINWIGGLPVSELVVYPKYQEPLMALCVAMLAGIGFSFLIKRSAGLSYFLVSAIAIVTTMIALSNVYLQQVLLLQRFTFFYYISIAAGVLCIVIAVSLVMWLSVAKLATTRRRLVLALVWFLSLELAVTYIVPVFYVLDRPPSASSSPYTGAPYIGFIRGRSSDHSRVFAREKLLYPNWSATFELADVRGLDAIYYIRYLAFIRNFLLPAGDTRRHGDLADRFTGDEFLYELDTDLERRFLALSSIKHIASSSEYGHSPKVLDAFADQYKGQGLGGFGPTTFLIGDTKKVSVPGMFQQPSSRRVVFKTFIDAKKPIFEVTAVSEVFNGRDGVGFELEVKDGDRIESVFSTALNPRDVPADRTGRVARVDLSSFAGKEIELLFSTNAGPSGSGSSAWAGWARPRFVGANDAEDPQALRKVYDNEALVYEVRSVLPRASLFSSVDILPDGDVLARLKDPAFNADQKVVLSRESLRDVDPGAARSLAEAPAERYSAARIISYQSQNVRIEAEATRASLLMLNDANYPGWHAYVNGKRAPIVAANYLFRGVIVPAGRSMVEFVYEPNSFRLGGAIAIAAFVILMGLVFRERRRRVVTFART